MRAPDGNAYPCIGTFREIVEAERIVNRVTQAFLKMKKFDIAELQRAAAGV